MPHTLNSSTSLKSYFLKSQISLSVITLLVCALGLTAIATHTFKKYSEYNLQLIAQSLSEQLQAAVVFDDQHAIDEIAHTFVRKYPIDSISVYSPDGDLLAEIVNPTQRHYPQYVKGLHNWLITSTAGNQNVIHNGQIIASVNVVNSISPLMSFLHLFLLVFILCIVFAFGIVWLSTHLIYTRINQSLDLLTDATELIAEKRAFQLRVPESEIQEFNKISHRFNDLLNEIQSWHSHLQQENSHLEHRALHDVLTHLPNRAFFSQRLSLLFNEHQLHQDFALLFIDNNNFKEINDTFGHQVGDAVLIEMSNRLKNTLRHNDFLARLGGDEFAILLYDINQRSQAIRVAQNLIRTALEPLHLENDQYVKFSFSIGIAMASDANSTSELIHLADQAMYQAKVSPYHWAIVGKDAKPSS